MAPVLSKAAALAGPQAALSGGPALNSADVLWSSRSVPVPILAGGGAESISFPAKKAATADLHSVFLKEFTLGSAPDSALMHLFAFTRYRLYVNGSYAGRGPCRYQNERPEYDTRDIGTLLKSGRNVLAVLAHRDAPTGRIMEHEHGFIAALEIVQAGSRQVIRTDTTWLSAPELSFGPRAIAWASIEEHIDARRMATWAVPDLSLRGWEPAVAVAWSRAVTLYPRSTPLQMESPLSWSTRPGELPLELVAGTPVSWHLAEIAQAFHVLEIDADEGSELEIRYCLPDGEDSGRCTYIARAGRQTYLGGDTFALKKLQLQLKSGRVTVRNISCLEMRYPFQRAAAFDCSDRFYSQLWTVCARSLEVLSEDAYVDCADRERVEWTDVSPPAFDCTRVMMRGPDEKGKSYWGDARLLRGLLRRIALTQQPDGQLKAHSCSERFDVHAIMEDRTCDWVVLLREYYESTGDAALVREQWPVLLRLMSWYRQRRTSQGLTLAREWEVWDNPLRYQVCEGAGLNAMVYRALVDASVLAKNLGKAADAESVRREAAQLRADYNRSLWNEAEGAYDGALFGVGSEVRSQLGKPFPGKIVRGRFRPTAQANLFALYAGIVPPERIASARRWILEHKSEVVEPMSYYYLFRMLYAMDEDGERDALALMKAGWQKQVESEWQTTWEELKHGGGSKVHVYGMHPGYFLTAYVLGARREAPLRERTLVIEPRFSGLAWARGVCVTEFGPVEMDWSVDAGSRQVTMHCDLPQGTQAKLRLRSHNKRATLRVDGKTRLPHENNGWLETGLKPGRHVVLFEAHPD